jgi:hypothetical protein
MMKRSACLLSRSLFILALVCCGSTLLAQTEDEVVEIFTQHYYDNLYITGNRLASGNLVAYVTLAESPASSEQATVVAKYVLNKQILAGDFTVYGEEGAPEALDFYSYENQPGYSQVEARVAEHNVRSVTLAALWLWEDYEAEQSTSPVPEQTTPICPGCGAEPNGCSPAWITPQSCGGHSLAPACIVHDICYQCGNFCWGHTRAQCDAQFRQRIQQITGNAFCAWTYWGGVRLIGWLFYQDPSLRPSMGGDAYSLGITLNACPPNQQHLCTTYVM